MKRFKKEEIIASICRLALCLAILGINTIAAADTSVGIYSASMAGGKTIGETGLVNTLQKASIGVETFVGLSMENLLKYRAVIIPNCRRLAKNEDKRWVDNLRSYVTECGGNLIFYHISVGHKRSPFNGDIPLFPEIVEPLSVERVETYDTKVVIDSVKVTFPFLPRYSKNQVIKHMYYDHFVFSPSGGDIILADPGTGQAVVAIGKVGKGRVVFNGMFGGKYDKVIVPKLEGIDRDILLSTVKWCLAGKGLVISSPDKIRVEKWQPKWKIKAKNKIALLFGRDFENALVLAKENIKRAGIDYDFIPLHFLPVRGLEKKDYALAIIFLQFGTGQDAVNVIKSYLSDGGRAIIFLPGSFSSRGAVADLLKMMGLKKGEGYRGNPGILRRIIFTDPNHLPREIANCVNNITAVSAVSGDAEVKAYWHDNLGKKKHPGVIATEYGVIVNSYTRGDHYNFRMFIANTVIDYVSQIKDPIYQNLLGICKQLESIISPKITSKAGNAYQAKAYKLKKEAADAVRQNNYKRAYAAIFQAQENLVKAYAASMTGIKDDLRTVFTVARGLDPEETCARLAKAGYKGVALSHMPGHYPSKLHKWGDDDKVDWMKAWIKAGKKNALKIGVSFATFQIHEGPAEAYKKAREGNWQVVAASQYGKPLKPLPAYIRRTGICRSHPEMSDYAIAKAAEIIDNYPIDHIFFDGIRWGTTCYCDFCKERFQKDSGIKIEKWPDDAIDKYKKEHDDWRATHVTKVIREVRRHIEKVNPKVKLGVIVQSGTRTKEGCRRKAQYWYLWTNYVDFVMPMYYPPNIEELKDILAKYNGLIPPGSRAKLAPCLGISNASIVTPYTWLQMIEVQRDLAPAGIMGYVYQMMSDPCLELLRIGPFRDRRDRDR